MEMSVYWPGVCCVSLYVCLCVFVCVISNQSSSEKLHVSDLSKIDSLLNQTHIKVVLIRKYQGLTCADS